MKKFLLLILLLTTIINPFKVSAEQANPEDIQIEAVIAMAEAYYDQGKQVHYDSYRKQLNATPEDATKQHIVYTVCSGFTFQAYYQALGIEIPDTTEELLYYAKDNEDSDYVLDYYTKADMQALGSTSTERGTAIFNSWLPIIRPGDLIVYTGHVMMVHTVDTDAGTIGTIEAAIGTRYDVSTHTDLLETEPTLTTRNLANKIGGFTSKDELALIRPIKDGNKYLKQSGKTGQNTYEEVDYSGLTPQAEARLRYNKIDIEKTIDIKDGSTQEITVGLGEEIEYTIEIQNKSSNTFTDLVLRENIPEILEIITTGGATLNNRTLMYNVGTLAPNEKKIYKYTVKVPDNPSLLGTIFVSTGDVSNIKTARIETLIGTKINVEKVNALKSAYDELKNNTSTERTFINDLYKKAFNTDLGLSNSLSNLDIMEYDASISTTGTSTSLAVKRTKLKESNVKKYIYHNFYGPRLFDGVNTDVNANRDCPDNNLVRITLHWNNYPEYELHDRARNIFPSMLMDGDIILLYTNENTLPDSKTSCPTETLENRSYIFLNNKLIRKKAQNDFEEITGTDLDTFLNDIVGENYIILRPSIDLLKVSVPNTDPEQGGNKDNNLEDNLEEEYIPIPDTAKSYQIPTLGIILIVLGLLVYYVSSKSKSDKAKDLM